jgi:CheY-like chemotaxis protein
MAFQSVDLNRTVTGMSGMLRRLMQEDIEHVLRLQPDLPCIKADPSQMEQVVLNLALNARDAMPGGGRLEIETSLLRQEVDGPMKYREVPPGTYVRLAVRDTGVGMSEELKSRIFEPFFTTKSLGKGTGMGLSTVYGIVQQSGGHIVVDSAPDRGSVFEVIFPAVAGADNNRAEEPAPVRVARQRCRETIMVAEDESSVRVFLWQLLAAQGYTVLAAANGNEAMEIALAYPGEIHLLITDVVMPGMGGRDLAERLGRERPSMRMLFISGYTDDAILHHGVLDGDTAFMNKPFPPASLLEKVRELLSVSSAQ